MPSKTPLGVKSTLGKDTMQAPISNDLNQGVPRKPSPSPLYATGGASNSSAKAQTQPNIGGGGAFGSSQSSFDRTGNSMRAAPPQQMNSTIAKSPQQILQEPLGPQPSKKQQQAQQLAALLRNIPQSSAAATSPSSLTVSPTMNGQDKSGLNSAAAPMSNNSSLFMSRQSNFSTRPSIPAASQGVCDIPDNNSASCMPMSNERLNLAPPPPSSYNVTNQSPLGRVGGGGNPSRGRSPARYPAGQASIGGPKMDVGVEASGGYNYNRIMEDHFDHYKRPASRERSVDQSNMPATLSEAPSKTFGRPPSSRARTPSVSSSTGAAVPLKVSSSRTDLDKRLEVLDDSKSNGGPPNLQGGSALKYRGPSQEVTHLGTVPKRTESMYFKPLTDEDSDAKVWL